MGIVLDQPKGGHRCQPRRVEIHRGVVTHRITFCWCGKQYGNPNVDGADRLLDGWHPFIVSESWLKLTAVNGNVQWVWCCQSCSFRQAIKHAEVPERVICGEAGVAYRVKDNSVDAPICERCGSTNGTELHHYAPRHLFDDPDNWAVGWLCRPCHAEWHRLTRTGSYYNTAASA